MIVGLTGKKQSGKSTIAKYLVEECGFIEYSIASPLKEISKILCGFTEQQLNTTQERKETVDLNVGISPREFLQVFGTEICRNLIPFYLPNMNLGKSKIIWVHLLSQFLLKNQHRNIVISDVRFPDEVDEIKDNNGIVIHIDRYMMNADKFQLHSSETQTLKYDYIVKNDKDVCKLLENVMEIIKK